MFSISSIFVWKTPVFDHETVFLTQNAPGKDRETLKQDAAFLLSGQVTRYQLSDKSRVCPLMARLRKGLE